MFYKHIYGAHLNMSDCSDVHVIRVIRDGRVWCCRGGSRWVRLPKMYLCHIAQILKKDKRGKFQAIVETKASVCVWGVTRVTLREPRCGAVAHEGEGVGGGGDELEFVTSEAATPRKTLTVVGVSPPAGQTWLSVGWKEPERGKVRKEHREERRRNLLSASHVLIKEVTQINIMWIITGVTQMRSDDLNQNQKWIIKKPKTIPDLKTKHQPGSSLKTTTTTTKTP